MSNETILFLAHSEADGFLSKFSLEALTAAKRAVEINTGSTFVVGLVGGSIEACAEQIGSCGAKRFAGVSGDDFAQARYASDAFALEAIARAVKPAVIVAAGTSRMNRSLPSLAYRLQGVIDTHVSDLLAAAKGFSVQRWYYRQRMDATLSRAGRPWIISVDSGNFPAWSGQASSPALDMLKVDLPPGGKRTTVLGTETPSGGEQTIRPDAELLLVAGAGWTKKQADGQVHAQQARELLLDFLGQTKASLGGSKSIVDMDSDMRKIFSFMSHLNQVGQTGATPRHQKGLSTCCHGEEPHVVGWRFVSERRAINLDPNCGWARGKADVLYVADAFDVLAKVNSLLSSLNALR